MCISMCSCLEPNGSVRVAVHNDKDENGDTSDNGDVDGDGE